MSDRDTFGPRLRAERERRGLSLAMLAEITNVSAELWDGLERSDLSRWPTGIFARSFVRDYSRAVGLDEREVVDEFCRLFPAGDRRAARIIEAHGAIIGHPTRVAPDAGGLPPEGDRRTASDAARAEASKTAPVLRAPRTIAAMVDTVAVLLFAGLVSLIFRTGFYESAGLLAILYYGLSTLTIGSSAGALVVAAIKQRRPAFFRASERRPEHA